MGTCKPTGILWLVATPIGHLKDVSPRALETLKDADLIVCEDTRVTRKLLDHYGIRPEALWTYHEHNAPLQRPKILQALQTGQTVALVSDAGTPLISDPGYRLVQEAQEMGLTVSAVPGACAAIMALILSGLPTDRFFFGGFLPRKKGEREALFASLRSLPATLIFYESAQRLLASLEDMKASFNQREIAFARELTKRFEEVKRLPYEDMCDHLKTRSMLKGEIVLLVSPSVEEEVEEEVLLKALDNARLHHTQKEAITLVAGQFGVARKRVYELALRALK